MRTRFYNFKVGADFKLSLYKNFLKRWVNMIHLRVYSLCFM